MVLLTPTLLIIECEAKVLGINIFFYGIDGASIWASEDRLCYTLFASSSKDVMFKKRKTPCTVRVYPTLDESLKPEVKVY